MVVVLHFTIIPDQKWDFGVNLFSQSSIFSNRSLREHFIERYS